MKIELATNEEIEKLYAKFKKFNTHLIENPIEIFPFVDIMDIYNRNLTEQEARDLLGYEQHNLKYGSSFLTAITQKRAQFFSRIAPFLYIKGHILEIFSSA
ncbi:hypothetical protein HHO41_03715 [Bacillus sp. DNRA2]|uniref:hypothetical protein n=1 Tax=Bacillus sp. DNRA2 TaxID=2723053 RepID=UPI00145DF94A|nr:hypothetical protein [Bacillus sp. DNRA2]NMD69383.1 hypothetical protein [Bacillus sp. DNRA2]